MDDTQKMEYARAFLQKEVESEFPYPFQILTEEDSFLFCFKNGCRDCCARLKATKGMLDRLCSGDKKVQKQEKERVLRVLEAAVEAQENMALSEKSEYGKMKNMLILRPLNLDFYRSELVNVPYIRIGDVALVLYCVLSHLGEDYFTTKVYRDQVQKWMVPEAEVMRAALVNTSFLYPPRLYSIQCLMGWDGKRYENGIFMGEDDEQKIPPGMRSYLLTNTLEINGAIAVFYPGVAEKIAQDLGGDFYIAFTSIHEAQIHGVGMISPEIVEYSLQETNRECTRPEEVLSNHVYLYNQEKKTFSMLMDGDFLEVEHEE